MYTMAVWFSHNWPCKLRDFAVCSLPILVLNQPFRIVNCESISITNTKPSFQPCSIEWNFCLLFLKCHLHFAWPNLPCIALGSCGFYNNVAWFPLLSVLSVSTLHLMLRLCKFARVAWFLFLRLHGWCAFWLIWGTSRHNRGEYCVFQGALLSFAVFLLNHIFSEKLLKSVMKKKSPLLWDFPQISMLQADNTPVHALASLRRKSGLLHAVGQAVESSANYVCRPGERRSLVRHRDQSEVKRPPSKKIFN